MEYNRCSRERFLGKFTSPDTFEHTNSRRYLPYVLQSSNVSPTSSKTVLRSTTSQQLSKYPISPTPSNSRIIYSNRTCPVIRWSSSLNWVLPTTGSDLERTTSYSNLSTSVSKLPRTTYTVLIGTEEDSLFIPDHLDNVSSNDVISFQSSRPYHIYQSTLATPCSNSARTPQSSQTSSSFT